MNINKLILLICALGGSFMSAIDAPITPKLKKCYLEYVSNLSRNRLEIDKNNLKIFISKESLSYKLKKPLVIPFVSIKYYLKQYIKDIPFVPGQAIKILTPKKQFYLWQNESGIICAPDPEIITSNDDWKAKSMFDPLKIKTTSNFFNLELLVDSKNKIKIKQI